jgi:hypothetical protein
MAETKDRMQRLRARRLAQGERPVELWLDPASHQRLLRLSDLTGGTFNQVIRRALVALEAQGNAHTAPAPPSALSDALSDDAESYAHPVPRKAPEAKAPTFSDQRREIIALLRQHPEGLSPVQTRKLLGIEKDLGNTMKSMARDGFLHRVRPGIYIVAEGQ